MRRAGLFLAVAGLVVAAGCVADESLLGADGDEEPKGSANLSLEWQGINAPEPFGGVQHRVLAVLLQPADNDTARVLWVGDAAIELREPGNATLVANGTVPAGDYEALALRLAGGARIEALPANASSPLSVDADQRTQPLEEVAHGPPADLVIEADIQLKEGDNRLLVTEDLGGDPEDDGYALPSIEQATGAGLQSRNHSVRLAPAGAIPAPTSPEADFRLALEDGRRLAEPGVANASFANGRSSPVMASDRLVLDPTASRPSAQTEGFLWAGVSVDGEGPQAFAVDEAGELAPATFRLSHLGVNEVTLTVVDETGGVDRKTLRVVSDRVHWTTTLFSDHTGDPTTWTTSRPEHPPGSLTRWQHQPNEFSDGGHFEIVYEGGEDGPGAVQDPYGPAAEARMTSPEIQIPADLHSAGYRFLAFGSSPAPDRLTVDMIVDGEAREVLNRSEVGAEEGAEGLGAVDGLANATGSTVRFRFTFTSDETEQAGEPWIVDILEVGGVDQEPKNPELWANAPP